MLVAYSVFAPAITTIPDIVPLVRSDANLLPLFSTPSPRESDVNTPFPAPPGPAPAILLIPPHLDSPVGFRIVSGSLPKISPATRTMEAVDQPRRQRRADFAAFGGVVNPTRKKMYR
jgi:hypothetical protein